MNTTKGQAEFKDYVVPMVLSIAGLILLILFLDPFQEASENLFDENLCRIEVQAHTTGLTLTMRQFESEINCPTGEIEKLDIEDSGTNKWIAESMRKCWFAFLEGESNLFVDDNVYCHPCRVFELTGEEDKLYGTNEYMRTTNIPGKDFTYFEYLQGFVSSDAENVRELRTKMENFVEVNREAWDSNHLEKGKKYATMFLFAKGKDNIRDLVSHLFMQTPEGKLAAGTSAVSGFILAGKAVGITTFVSGVLTMIGVSSPVGWVGMGVIAVGSFVTGAAVTEGAQLALLNQIESSERVAYVVLIEHTADNYEKLNCDYEPIPINT